MIPPLSDRVERVVLVAALVLASSSTGFALARSTQSPVPTACVEALDAADRLDDTQMDLLTAVRVRGDALGREAYRLADDEVNALIEQGDPIANVFNTAAESCRGSR